jgi:hypothetical protein
MVGRQPAVIVVGGREEAGGANPAGKMIYHPSLPVCGLLKTGELSMAFWQLSCRNYARCWKLRVLSVSTELQQGYSCTRSRNSDHQRINQRRRKCPTSTPLGGKSGPGHQVQGRAQRLGEMVCSKTKLDPYRQPRPPVTCYWSDWCVLASCWSPGQWQVQVEAHQSREAEEANQGAKTSRRTATTSRPSTMPPPWPLVTRNS